MKRLIKIDEAAKILGYSTDYFYRIWPRLKKRGLKVYRVSPKASPMFSEDDLIAVLERIGSKN